MTYDEIVAAQKLHKRFVETEIGAAFNRFRSCFEFASRLDAEAGMEAGVSATKLGKAWEASDRAEKQLLDILHKLAGVT